MFDEFSYFLVLSLLWFTHTSYAQDYNIEHTYRIKPCEECDDHLEMSGLTLYKDYVFMLPQHENAIYYEKLNKIRNNNSSSSLTKIPFSFESKAKKNDGWEAIAIRTFPSDSLYIYLALEKCGGEHSCIYYSKITFTKNNEQPFESSSIRQFGKENPGWKNLSYEAMSWIEYPEHNISGLLLLPEKISHEKLNPIFIKENGEYMRVSNNNGLEYLRISDMAAVTPQINKSYIAVSFCWKGTNRAFTHADKWCFNNFNNWESKLELLTLNIEPKNGEIHVDLINKRRLKQSFVEVKGPDKSRSHEYNAEGIAVLPNGDIMVINDNYPDGSYTEIRILSLNIN